MLALVKAQRCPVAVEHAANQRANLRLGVLALDPGQAIEVEPVEQILMDAALQFLIGGVPGFGDRRNSGSMTADERLIDGSSSLGCVPMTGGPRECLSPPGWLVATF